MRSSRLVSILLELTRSPRTTVKEIAQRHGVTPRTIQRDIAALHTMGVPIWTRTGPSGGVGLVEGWRSPITGMTSPELQALVVGTPAARDLGMQAELETAQLKMLTATSAQTDAVEPAQERIFIDNDRWFAPLERPAALTAVAEAVWSGRRLTIYYQRPGRDTTVRRRLDPLGLVLKTDRWYLVAAHRGSLRTYRLSRITDTVMHDDDARRPAGFSLADYWNQSRAEFEATIYTLSVRLSVPTDSVDQLRAAVPGDTTQYALDSASAVAERLELDLPMERLDIAAAQLLPVPGVEVISPAELRQALFERGEDLIAHNRSKNRQQ